MKLPAHIQRIKDELIRDMQNPHDKSHEEYVRLLFVAWNDMQTLLKEDERLRAVTDKLGASLQESGFLFNEETDQFDIPTYFISQEDTDTLGRMLQALKPHDAQEGGDEH